MSQLEKNHLAGLTCSNRGAGICFGLILHDGTNGTEKLLDANLAKSSWSGETTGNLSDGKSLKSLMKHFYSGLSSHGHFPSVLS